MVALIGSSMIEAWARSPKPCQSSPARSIQSSRSGCLRLRKFRAPDLEPPFLAEFVIHLAHGAAEIQRLNDRLFDQRRTARRLHHRCRYIAGGNDGVLRRGGRVHQVGLVEHVTVELHRLLGSPAPESAMPATDQPTACGSIAWRKSSTPCSAGGPRQWRGSRHRTHETPRAAARLHQNAACQSGRPASLDVFDVIEHAVVGALRDGQHARFGGLVGDERDWRRSLPECCPRQNSLRGIGPMMP